MGKILSLFLAVMCLVQIIGCGDGGPATSSDDASIDDQLDAMGSDVTPDVLAADSDKELVDVDADVVD